MGNTSSSGSNPYSALLGEAGGAGDPRAPGSGYGATDVASSEAVFADRLNEIKLKIPELQRKRDALRAKFSRAASPVKGFSNPQQRYDEIDAIETLISLIELLGKDLLSASATNTQLALQPDEFTMINGALNGLSAAKQECAAFRQTLEQDGHRHNVASVPSSTNPFSGALFADDDGGGDFFADLLDGPGIQASDGACDANKSNPFLKGTGPGSSLFDEVQASSRRAVVGGAMSANGRAIKTISAATAGDVNAHAQTADQIGSTAAMFKKGADKRKGGSLLSRCFPCFGRRK